MKLTSVIKEMLLIIIGNFFYLISIFIRKRPDLWVFGGLLGQGYNDNSKYLFEYINNEKKDVEAIYITQSSNVVDRLRKKGLTAYKGFSLKGIWAMMRAGAAVISHSRVRDLKPFVITPKAKLIQLWHGIPLKKIEFDDTVFFNKQSFGTKLKFFLISIVSPAFRRKFDLLISCSPEDQQNFSTAFCMDKDLIKITGYPRNDIIVSKKNDETPTTHKILYVPTFRGKEKSDFMLFEKYEFDFKRFDLFLKKENAEFHIKLHPYNKPSKYFFNSLKESHHIKFFSGDDIYSRLHLYDILVTDYSSIFFDYLLLDRPIVFAPFDFSEYLKMDRELYYDYDTVTPGPKAYTWKELEQNLSSFIKDPELFFEERCDVKQRFHRHYDALSGQRVYEHIVNLGLDSQVHE